VLRAPVVALSGGGGLSAYEWGAFACLLVTGMVGLYLARLAAERGAPWFAQGAIVGVCLLNPLTVNAMQTGHPEEMFTAALLVAAVAVASEGHRGRATLLLGLAIASKQWAVLGALPVLMALPTGRTRAALGAAGIALVLTIPFLVANPDGFLTTHRSLAFETQAVTSWSAWYPFSHSIQVYVPDLHATFSAHRAPPLVAKLSHPLILLIAIVVPLALARRRRSLHLSGADAMALLALLALLRCMLDPVNNLYYHEPLLLALVGWDALASRLPIRALAAAGILYLVASWQKTSAVQFSNALYLCLAAIATIAIALELFRRRDPQRSGQQLELDPTPGFAHAPFVRP
jgi:hypothetical protein